jgi:hypothetical protein
VLDFSETREESMNTNSEIGGGSYSGSGTKTIGTGTYIGGGGTF